MATRRSVRLLNMERTCVSLLHELEIIWDEVGETDEERDNMLLEIERECLEVYRRRVDKANKNRAQLRQAIADSEAELAAICSSLGEPPVHTRQIDQHSVSLKAELRTLLPQLEEMQKRKCDRKSQFLEVSELIHKIKSEIYGPNGYITNNITLDETDLSLRKLEELHRELQALQEEKNERLKSVLNHINTLNSLCSVLGLDFHQTLYSIHPSLVDTEESKSISNDTIDQLASAIRRLKELKLQRMQQLQDLATSLLELWNLMDTPADEQRTFQNVTSNVAASEDEITEPNMLSIDYINYVKAEVSRLEELKISKMKELVLKKRFELEEICRKTHIIPAPDNALDIAIEAIESGVADAANVLEQVECQIAKVKEEAYWRKDILEKVEKWMSACEEECWLEEYNRDDNRYSAVKGAHLTLKRAEKARALVAKLPAMVEALASKTAAWEKETGLEFTYDGIRLLSMLEEYSILQQEKELERKRQREEKKLQGQLIAEQEALYGSKPSPMKIQSAKKGSRLSCGGAAVGNRRLSVGGTMIQTPKATPNTRLAKKNDHLHTRDKSSNNKHDGATGALSAARRGLDIAGLPVIKHNFGMSNYGELESSSPMVRKPFSPVSDVVSKSNTSNFASDDPNRKQADTVFKTLVNKTSFITPTKTTATSAAVSVEEDENKTQRTTTTPFNASLVPMQTAMTPATPAVVHVIHKELTGTLRHDDDEEIEYSFEERRLMFLHAKTTNQ